MVLFGSIHSPAGTEFFPRESFKLEKINISSCEKYDVFVVWKQRWRKKVAKKRRKILHSDAELLLSIPPCLFFSPFFRRREENCVLFIFSRHKLWFFVLCVGTVFFFFFVFVFLLVGRRGRLQAFSAPTQWTLRQHTRRNGKRKSLLALSLFRCTTIVAWLGAKTAKVFIETFLGLSPVCNSFSSSLSTISAKVKNHNNNVSDFYLIR